MCIFFASRYTAAALGRRFPIAANTSIIASLCGVIFSPFCLNSLSADYLVMASIRNNS
ncbi:MAG: hypothetical protein PHD64_12010 [Mesotoga sp.]|nr:hypothetical protein [Mesotoga sp.]